MLNKMPVGVFVALVLFQTISCAPRAPLKAVEGFKRIYSEEERVAAFSEYVSKQQAVSYRVIANATVKSSGDSQSLRYAFVFLSPNYTRLEAFPPTSFYSLFALVQNPNGCTLVDNSKREKEVSKDCELLMNKIMNLRIEPQALARLLLGRISGAMSEAMKTDKWNIFITKDFSKALWQSQRKDLELVFDRATKLISEVYVIDPFRDLVTAKVSLGELSEVRPGYFVPTEINIEYPEYELKVTIKVQKFIAEPSLKMELFELGPVE